MGPPNHEYRSNTRPEFHQGQGLHQNWMMKYHIHKHMQQKT